MRLFAKIHSLFFQSILAFSLCLGMGENADAKTASFSKPPPKTSSQKAPQAKTPVPTRQASHFVPVLTKPTKQGLGVQKGRQYASSSKGRPLPLAKPQEIPAEETTPLPSTEAPSPTKASPVAPSRSLSSPSPSRSSSSYSPPSRSSYSPSSASSSFSSRLSSLSSFDFGSFSKSSPRPSLPARKPLVLEKKKEEKHENPAEKEHDKKKEEHGKKEEHALSPAQTEDLKAKLKLFNKEGATPEEITKLAHEIAHHHHVSFEDFLKMPLKEVEDRFASHKAETHEEEHAKEHPKKEEKPAAKKEEKPAMKKAEASPEESQEKALKQITEEKVVPEEKKEAEAVPEQPQAKVLEEAPAPAEAPAAAPVETPARPAPVETVPVQETAPPPPPAVEPTPVVVPPPATRETFLQNSVRAAALNHSRLTDLEYRLLRMAVHRNSTLDHQMIDQENHMIATFHAHGALPADMIQLWKELLQKGDVPPYNTLIKEAKEQAGSHSEQAIIDDFRKRLKNPSLPSAFAVTAPVVVETAPPPLPETTTTAAPPVHEAPHEPEAIPA